MPFTGKVASKGEIAYARFAERTLVLSRTLDTVGWKNTRIVRDIAEIGHMKQQPGNDMHAIGGATLVGSLMNQGLDELLRVAPGVGAYVAESDFFELAWQQSFWGSNYPRLRPPR